MDTGPIVTLFNQLMTAGLAVGAVVCAFFLMCVALAASQRKCAHHARAPVARGSGSGFSLPLTCCSRCGLTTVAIACTSELWLDGATAGSLAELPQVKDM